VLRTNNRSSHENHTEYEYSEESTHLHADANILWLVSWGALLLALLCIDITEYILKFTFLKKIKTSQPLSERYQLSWIHLVNEIVVVSSLAWCMFNMISDPPTNSPLINIWGNVGQLLQTNNRF
jgi:hypothetical protein